MGQGQREGGREGGAGGICGCHSSAVSLRGAITERRQHAGERSSGGVDLLALPCREGCISCLGAVEVSPGEASGSSCDHEPCSGEV